MTVRPSTLDRFPPAHAIRFVRPPPAIAAGRQPRHRRNGMLEKEHA